MTTAHPNWLEVAALVVLVCFSAFFSASETALVAVSRLRARALIERKVRGADDVLKLVDDKSHMLSSILIGNTVALLAADSLATAIMIDLGLPDPAVWSTVLMSVVLLLFGEIIPKTVASSAGERYLLFLGKPMRLANAILTPITSVFIFIANVLLRIVGVKHSTHMYVTEEDIRALVNVGAEQRVIEEEEREMIHSVIEFGDTIVREIMTPRPEVIAVSIDDSPRRALDVVIAEGYSKLPVYQESKDDIIGVVHDRELLIALSNGTLSQTSLRALMRPVQHVPETKKIAELLRDMQREKYSMAIVMDEYGGTAGLVTMEDLLEEIVGEIRDEHDIDEQEPIHVISENEAVVEAGTNIDDVNAELGTHIPTEDFETIGGYIVGLFGRLPKEGEEIEADSRTRFKVERTRGRRILSVRVFTRPPVAEEEGEGEGAEHDVVP
ncbi:MAG: HlyC/CorC family transporter [Candidatus Eremiobacteraeota bacterium]|nr:HlyC/CorC family transporter [Candidatus Eremiobacteraeota bacterium]